MRIYANIDEFYDTLLQVETSYIKVHSYVLAARSEYFKALLEGGFSEQLAPGDGKKRIIQIHGVNRTFMKPIVQYLYSDHFYLTKNSLDFFL